MSKKLQRRQAAYVRRDLNKKMVLLAGPRQCGKTTIAESFLEELPGRYYNWDVGADRRLIREQHLDEAARLWVFDELHKYRQWRNWLKGTYDIHKDRHQILVTGSARLDIYGRGGDSLQGRYFKHRLHPFTWAELNDEAAPKDVQHALDQALQPRPRPTSSTLWDDFMELGGFPEPLLSGSATEAARWRNLYGELLVREDVRTLESIRDLDRLELLYERLPQTVGSVLSINALREDLEVAFETVRHWLSVLENMYSVFRLPPFGAPRIKAVKKEQKLYCWDWSRVQSSGARFENLVALHLLRFVHWAADVFGEKIELRYFRDTVGHEVDFVVCRQGKVWFALECKSSDRGLDKNLRYLCERVEVPVAIQLTQQPIEHARLGDIGATQVHTLCAHSFLLGLP